MAVSVAVAAAVVFAITVCCVSGSVEAVCSMKSLEFSAQWTRYEERRAANVHFVSDDLESDLFERYYLVYAPSPHEPLEKKWLGAASAALYALLTDRILFVSSEMGAFPGLAPFVLPMSVDRLLLLGRNSKTYNPLIGPRPRAKFLELAAPGGIEELQLFGCSSVDNGRRVQFLMITASEYFAPLLILNEHFRETVQTLFPGHTVFATISDRVLVKDVKIAGPPTKTSLVFGEEKYDPGLDRSAASCLNVHSNASAAAVVGTAASELFIMSGHPQHLRYFASRRPYRIHKIARQQPLSDSHRLQDILYASSNVSRILSTHGSALGELVGALARAPPQIIGGCGCRQTKSSDPCYAGASLKAFVKACVGDFAGNHEYADLFARPEYIDACKSQTIGIQIVPSAGSGLSSD